MRFEPPTLKFRGALAQAMNAAYQQRKRDVDYSGRMQCPWCTAPLSFTVTPNGLSRGQCAAGCGVRWSQ